MLRIEHKKRPKLAWNQSAINCLLLCRRTRTKRLCRQFQICGSKLTLIIRNRMMNCPNAYLETYRHVNFPFHIFVCWNNYSNLSFWYILMLSKFCCLFQLSSECFSNFLNRKSCTALRPYIKRMRPLPFFHQRFVSYSSSIRCSMWRMYLEISLINNYAADVWF